MLDIRGIIVPILTPMYENEEINLDELKNQIDRQIDAGIHGIFCLGTNGEFYNMTADEKIAVIQTTVQRVAGRCPVYAGTGCPGTGETIRLSLRAKELGVDALSIISPYFAAVSQNEVYEHFAAVAKAVDLPILVYNMPARTGVNIAPATMARLAEIDNIVGAKDSSGNFDNMLQYIELTRGKDFTVLSGNDSLIYWNLLAGGKGGIAGCANVYPKTLVSVYELFVSGDLQAAKTAQDSIRPLRNVFAYGNPNTIVKAAAGLLGYPIGPCRAPFNMIPAEGMKALQKTIDADKAAGLS